MTDFKDIEEVEKLVFIIYFSFGKVLLYHLLFMVLIL